MPVVLLIAFLLALALSALTTAAMKRIAPRIGLVANPGAHRTHKDATPLGGGVGIFVGLCVPLLVITGSLALLDASGVFDPDVREVTVHGDASPFDTRIVQNDVTQTPLGIDPDLFSGLKRQTPLAVGFLVCCTILMVLGLIDDRRPLGAFLKLLVQLAVTAVFVAVFDVRLLTALGYLPSVLLTVLWITAVTNALNFLDNMDGLSAGVATVCSVALFVAAMSVEPPQWFVAGTLALLVGALVGFLIFNFPPASIFMGDAGSLVIGFVLGVLTVRTTFLPADASFGARWYATLAPLLILALPLYDMVTVCVIRIARGKSPFKADNNHFSHRLVARGMSRRTAVLCLYLVTACTSIAAIILPQVQSHTAAALIVGQVVLILGVVALLEQHPMPESDER
ncbi:MAG: MraY family glycosyltransferase [Planctomycetota bacterium]